MMPAPSIRNASIQDSGAISDLIRLSFRDVAQRFSLTKDNCPRHPSNCTKAWVEADLERGDCYFVLETEQEAVGCVALENTDSGPWELKRLAVSPGHRRQGLGRSLVEYAVAFARENGATEVCIGIIADYVELKDWYSRLGFVEAETKRFAHLPFPVTYMKLTISKSLSD